MEIPCHMLFATMNRDSLPIIGVSPAVRQSIVRWQVARLERGDEELTLYAVIWTSGPEPQNAKPVAAGWNRGVYVFTHPCCVYRGGCSGILKSKEKKDAYPGLALSETCGHVIEKAPEAEFSE
jgi:hypothetical protein